MQRHLRIPAALAALVATAAFASGCGDDVPSGAVAKVGDVEITKADFDHWLTAAARQQAQGQPGSKPQAVVVPDPPSFAKCVQAKQSS